MSFSLVKSNSGMHGHHRRLHLGRPGAGALALRSSLMRGRRVALPVWQTARMVLGLMRGTRAHPVDLENLAYAAHDFREALISLHGIGPD
ncbi:MAG: hypothetical protein ACRDTD_32255, partial [Pseudonocardiaceae bacterium]